jgi:uncharacterized protein (TIGR03083 family)
VTYDPIPTIRREADAFLAAARRGLEPQVPGCPEWTVRELTQHLGSVYRFHTRHVGRGVTDPPEPFAAELPDDADLLQWFDDSVDELLIVLRSVDPAAPAWNWASHTPQVAAFWPRRMALESAVHRWDAESAHNEAAGFDLPVAVDGIDEMVTVMGPTNGPDNTASGTAVIRPTDEDVAWAMRFAPGLIEVLPTVPDRADALLEGTASALLLALWGRDVDITATGDPAIVELLTS